MTTTYIHRCMVVAASLRKFALDFFRKTEGMKYDLRGAIATVFLGAQNAARWFCNEWVAAPFLRASGTFGPHQFAAIALSLGRDVTAEFFESRK